MGTDPRTSLIGLEREALAAALGALGVPERQLGMRARQLWQWIYRHGARDFEAMTTLPRDLRLRLAAAHTVARPEIAREQLSSDGTRKWLLRFEDGREVETVLIPEADRGALCVSTQVGCSLTCSFCHTGTMSLVRNLGAHEIVQQVLVARDRLGEWPSPSEGRRLTNLVAMGMGEPLLNDANTARAMRIVMDGEGIDLSRRRITLSTSGVVPRIGPWGREVGTGLAVSLHAVRDELRNELVPINRKWPIEELLAACRDYPSPGRPITFEYVMLDRVNDSDADARELVRILHGLRAKVNLIPFNPWPGAPYRCSPEQRIEAFARIVQRAGYPSPLRTPRGRDILAACGQLKTASERARRRALEPA
jgi:23S rRNA (adenine2503-C2)-methyltransferase